MSDLLTRIENGDPVTAQELFDHVVKHLIAQGGPAQDFIGSCFYRGPNGRRCAAGCVIPDALYVPVMEAKTVCGLENRGLLPVSLKPYVSLLTRLQDAHDTNNNSRSDSATWEDVERLGRKLRKAATEFGLDASVVPW